MKYIKRTAADHLKSLAKQFPVVAVMGPRQSGKSTLTRETFPKYSYVSMENLAIRAKTQEDPEGFFATYADKPGLIIDEIQEVPELFSYMQGIVDQEYKPGFFIVTGSQNFLLHEKITQTLAGRIALLTLLPLSIQELVKAKLLPNTIEEFLFKGCYPRPYVQPFDVHQWFSSYISTYVEKDVRQITRVTDLVTFQRFLSLCAGRAGQLLNYAELARDADISPNTAKAWISMLEASYIIMLLQPYYRNFNKRIIKTPKLYFNDTGLLCDLLGIQSSKELHTHAMRGAIFESLIVSQICKYRLNQGEKPNLYFWRDVQGHEVDCIIENSFDKTRAVEIKSGMTLIPGLFKNLDNWHDLTQQKGPSFIVYAGRQDFLGKHHQAYSWLHLEKMLNAIYEK